MFSAPFPQALVDLYKVLAFSGFGIEVAAPQCAIHGITYYAIFLSTLFALGLIMCMLAGKPFAAVIRKRRRGQGFRVAFIDVIVSDNGARAFRDMFVVVLLLHPSISGKAMQFFRCRTIDEVPYLMADYSIKC